MKTFADGLEYFINQEHFTTNKSKIEELRSDFMLLICISRQEKGFLCESDFEDAYSNACDMNEHHDSFENEGDSA